MPRFYFDMTVDGIAQADDAGLDLPSPEAARRDTMVTVAEMAKDHAAGVEIVVDIRDSERDAIARVRLSRKCEEPFG
jgi:hypothetical protein